MAGMPPQPPPSLPVSKSSAGLVPGRLLRGCLLSDRFALISSSPLLRVALLQIILQVVAINDAALHHEFHALHLGDVRERVARNRHEIGELPFLHAPDLLP